ncbi:hypothetical protein L211DRAFT_870899 [Terfezia boudieri ATCC MYA-4762]|uniref:Uncharacterized protein n=1 Tax=Terfezia boudieri ATCC MYA-4762 TaxID=1051890 RepID=A0A3N4LAY9_9PEZI|nr:hypothetical protein L211DRAFT_870899 [Terfezia boudieri ATCC MYA-4762]
MRFIAGGRRVHGEDKSVSRRRSGKKKLPWVDVVPVEVEGVEEFRVRGKMGKKGMVSECENDERKLEYRNMRGRFDGKRVMYIEDDDEEEEEEYRFIECKDATPGPLSRAQRAKHPMSMHGLGWGAHRIRKAPMVPPSARAAGTRKISILY